MYYHSDLIAALRVVTLFSSNFFLSCSNKAILLDSELDAADFKDEAGCSTCEVLVEAVDTFDTEVESTVDIVLFTLIAGIALGENTEWSNEELDEMACCFCGMLCGNLVQTDCSSFSKDSLRRIGIFDVFNV